MVAVIGMALLILRKGEIVAAISQQLSAISRYTIPTTYAARCILSLLPEPRHEPCIFLGTGRAIGFRRARNLAASNPVWPCWSGRSKVMARTYVYDSVGVHWDPAEKECSKHVIRAKPICSVFLNDLRWLALLKRLRTQLPSCLPLE